MAKKEIWEVPEINLDLRNKKYKGKDIDAIIELKNSIEKYLTQNPNIDEKTRQVYSSIYNALNYYYIIRNEPSQEFSSTDTFLNYAISEINNDYMYLSKYNRMFPDEDQPIIEICARIKSPISFLNKVKGKINDFLKEGNDLGYLNDSLRDLFGAQIIVNVPKSIKEQGEDAETDFLYKVYLDFLKYHQVSPIPENEKLKHLQKHKYNFLPVNDHIHPNRLEKIKSRIAEEGFDEGVLNEIKIPQSRPPEMEQDEINSITRDYVKSPKRSGYQSLHVYAYPESTINLIPGELPPGIIPPKNSKCAIEYHFYTKDQFNYQAYGKASHKNLYKPHEKTYHRLAVPLFITLNNQNQKSNTNNENSIIPDSIQPLKRNNFADCFKRFYGISFKDFFGVDFSVFNTFKENFQNDILALESKVVTDEKLKTTTVVPYDKPFVASIDELKTSKDIIENYINVRNDKSLIERTPVKPPIGNRAFYVIVKKANSKKLDLPSSQIKSLIGSLNYLLKKLRTPNDYSQDR